MVRIRAWAMAFLLLAWLPAHAAEPASPVVRLSLVNIADDVLRPLLPDFEAQSGLRAEIVYMGSDPYAVARAGKADLVISHYGHPGVEPFVSAGLGNWPHTVFSNQVALFGPAGDPARVRGLTDAAEAFARIAATKARFVANSSPGAAYLEQILWRAAGVESHGAWRTDEGAAGRAAAETASRQQAYVLWGVAPYLRHQRRSPLAIEPLVLADPILQRVMVAVVVRRAEDRNTNEAGARAFEDFLLSPATQSRIRDFRYPGLKQQVWWPAGRHNGQSE